MPPKLIPITLDLVFLGLGAWLLFSRYRADRSPWLREPLIIVFTAVLHALAGIALPLALDMNLWITARIWSHSFFLVACPLALARGTYLLFRRRNGRVPAALLLAFGLCGGVIYLHGRFVAPYQFEVRRYTVVSDRLEGMDNPLKIVVLSDLQVENAGEYERRVFKRMDAEKADLILFPGDYIQARSSAAFWREHEKIAALFKSLEHEPPLGIFAVNGDVEGEIFTLKGMGVTLLENTFAELPEGCPIQLAGLKNRHSRRPLNREVLRRAEAFPGLTLVMGHSPDYAQCLLDGSVDLPLLCVAGHTHGGQVVIPGFGPIVTLSKLPRKYSGGMHKIGNSWLMVSRGIGMERGAAPRVRIFCPPELVVIELRPPGEANAVKSL